LEVQREEGEKRRVTVRAGDGRNRAEGVCADDGDVTKSVDWTR
jgi:hypothetical protein